MAPAKKRKRKRGKLPNAPLVEAVFEIRWALPGAAGDSVNLLYADPGYLPALSEFTKRISRIGYPVARDIGGSGSIPVPYTVGRRFYLSDSAAFPLMQLGPGIFATNQSAEYEWESFKRQILAGLRQLLASYPSLPTFPLRPNYLELRYLNAFDESLVGTLDLLEFLNSGTTLRFETPSFFAASARFGGPIEGRIILNRSLKGRKSSTLAFDLGSGRRGEREPIIRSETKVFTRQDGVPKLRAPPKFLEDVESWLDFAYSITSPLFKALVTPDLMRKFEGN